MYTGPHLIKDNLTFGYDTGYVVADNITSTRFYKGAPTENYIHGQNAVAQDSYTTYSATSAGSWNTKHPNAIRAYNAGGGDITGYINTGVGDWQNTYHAHWQYDPILKKPVVVMNDFDGQWKAKSYGTGLGTWTSQGKTHGDTYTISWLQWVDNLSKNAKAGLYTKNSSGGNGFHDGQANSASAYNTKLNTWQRVYQTYTTNANRDLNQSLASIYMYGHYSLRATVKIADVQFTWGSTPLPYSAKSERTSTESLIDLTNKSNIDVSTISFDTYGQPEFDGTDDIINTGLLSGRNPSSSPFSIEAIVKSDTTSGNRMWLDATNNGSNQRLYCAHASKGSSTPMGIQASGWSHSIPQDTEFHHYVLVMDGSVARLYNNGEPHSTKNYTSYQIQSINVGGRSGYRWVGKIPVFKIHNEIFTADKVKHNFNVYKNRFGI
jgi:hypothetical protein